MILLCILLGVTPSWELSTSLTHAVSLSAGSGGIWAATTGGVYLYDVDQSGFPELITYPDGLPGIACNDVLEDSNSSLWIATDNGGLARRDGSVWTVFTSFDGIPGDDGRIYCLEEAGGFIWAGTTAGMARGQDGSFVPVDGSTTGGAFPGVDVRDIESDGEKLWTATDTGVFSLDLSGSPFSPSSWTSFQEETGGLGIFDIAAGGGIEVAAAGTEGVYLFDGTDWRLVLEDSTVSEVEWGDWGLMAAADGIMLYEDGNWEPLGSGYPECIIGPYYADGLLMLQGTLWCGLGSFTVEDTGWGRGLGSLSSPDGQWNELTVPGQPAKSVYQMLLDGDRLFLGSHKAGLLAMYPGGWSVWGMDQGLPSFLRVYGCADAEDGDIWTSTYHYGVTWLGGASTPDPSDDSLLTFVADPIAVPPVCSWTLAPLLNNQVLMLARQGATLWMPQEAFWQAPEEPSGLTALTGSPPDTSSMVWTSFETGSSGLASKNLKTVLPIGDDMIWIAFASDGCQLLDHGGTVSDPSDDIWLPYGHAFSTDDGLPSEIVNCFAETLSGEVLVGTGAGLCTYDGSGGFTPVDGVTGSVKALAVDGAGRIWSNGTTGITVIEGGQATTFDESNSPYRIYNRVEGEFSAVSLDGSTVYFSSGNGLWNLTVQSSGGTVADDPCFYPQPWLPAEGSLRMCELDQGGESTGYPLSVAIFSLEGAYLTTVDASSAEAWEWDGTVDGVLAGSGIYMAVIACAGENRGTAILLVR